MKKLFARFKKEVMMSFSDDFMNVQLSTGEKKEIRWDSVVKLVFVNSFEEYSGYFLTDEYKRKELYKDICINCKRNTVRIRTGGAPTIENNAINPFLMKFGMTSIPDAVFTEYKDDAGEINLYVVHYNKSKKDKLIEQLKIKISNIYYEQRIEGFSYISKL